MNATLILAKMEEFVLIKLTVISVPVLLDIQGLIVRQVSIVIKTYLIPWQIKIAFIQHSCCLPLPFPYVFFHFMLLGFRY